MPASTRSRSADGGGVATSRASSAVVSSNSATSCRQLSQYDEMGLELGPLGYL